MADIKCVGILKPETPGTAIEAINRVLRTLALYLKSKASMQMPQTGERKLERHVSPIKEYLNDHRGSVLSSS